MGKLLGGEVLFIFGLLPLLVRNDESAHPESDIPTERRKLWQGTVAELVCSIEVLEWGHMSAYSSSHRIDTPLADQVYGQQPCSIPSVSLDRRWLAIDCR